MVCVLGAHFREITVLRDDTYKPYGTCFILNVITLFIFQLPIVLPIFLFCVSIVLLALTIHQRPDESLTTVLMMALGIPFYVIGVGWKNKPKTLENTNCK